MKTLSIGALALIVSYGFGTQAVVAESKSNSNIAIENVLSDKEAMKCVQTRLNELEFSAGKADGLFGGKTKTASQNFFASQTNLYGLQPLSSKNAMQWCTTLQSANDGKAFVSATKQGTIQFKFGPDIDATVRQHTVQATAEVDEFFEQKFGTSLQIGGQVYVSSDANWLTENYIRQRKLRASYRKGKIDYFRGCHGGEAGPEFMFMCAGSRVFSEDWFGSGLAAQRTYAFAHEYFHMLQYELVGDRSKGCCGADTNGRVIGPMWLVEGSAEYIAFLILGESDRMNFAREIDWHTQKSLEVQKSLSGMVTRQGFASEPRASSAGMIAVHYLVETNGLGSLKSFWISMGNGLSWQNAFEKAFGLSPKTFEKEYTEKINSH